VKEKQGADSDAWRRRERRAPGDYYGRWGTRASNGVGVAGTYNGATEARATGGGPISVAVLGRLLGRRP
jgi:hypothetical protein